MYTYHQLVEKYGYCNAMTGINEDSETVIIAIDEEQASIRTLQSNDWMRINVYHKDGTSEEYYEK